MSVRKNVCQNSNVPMSLAELPDCAHYHKKEHLSTANIDGFLFPFFVFSCNCSEPAATHMGTGALVRAAPHEMPVPTCVVLNRYFFVFIVIYSYGNIVLCQKIIYNRYGY